MKLPIRRARVGVGSRRRSGGSHSGRQIAGRFLVAREQVGDDGFGLAHHPHHPRMPVHPLFQERLDVRFRLRDRRRKRDQRIAIVAHIVGRLRPGDIEPPTRFRDDRADQIAKSARAPVRRRAGCHRDRDNGCRYRRSSRRSAASLSDHRRGTGRRAGRRRYRGRHRRCHRRSPRPALPARQNSTAPDRRTPR